MKIILTPEEYHARVTKIAQNTDDDSSPPWRVKQIARELIREQEEWIASEIHAYFQRNRFRLALNSSASPNAALGNLIFDLGWNIVEVYEDDHGGAQPLEITLWAGGELIARRPSIQRLLRNRPNRFPEW